jgi:hypothetical protein
MTSSKLSRRWVKAGPLALLASTAGCGSAGSSGAPGEVGTYDLDGSVVLASGDAGAPLPLDAHIEDHDIVVTFVTLSCADSCADIEAVATGGNPPYSFQWADGTTGTTRHVCPTSTRTYGVTVKDTAVTGELPHPQATATASLTADVVSCPDGGARDGGSSGGACIQNPSFEGTAAVLGFDAPPWTTCGPALPSQDTIWNATLSGSGLQSAPPSPSDGQTYLVLAPNQGIGTQHVSGPLCATMRAGTTYAVRIDLTAYDGVDGGPEGPLETLQIWGAGGASCAESELLWTSPPIASGSGWSTYCATLTPTEDTTYLSFASAVPTGSTGIPVDALCVDHLVPVAACP